MSDLIWGFLLGIFASAIVAIPIYWRQNRILKKATDDLRTTIEKGNRELAEKDDNIVLVQQHHSEILGELASIQSEELGQIKGIANAQAGTSEYIVSRIRTVIEEAAARNAPLEEKEIASKKILISSGATFSYNIQPLSAQITLKDEVKPTVHKPYGTTETSSEKGR